MEKDFTLLNGIDGWNYDISEVGSDFVGIKIVNVIEGENEAEEKCYVVALEEVNELAKWSEDLHHILNELVINPTFDFHFDFTDIIETFETVEEALAYAQINYKKKDMVKVITNRYREVNGV